MILDSAGYVPVALTNRRTVSVDRSAIQGNAGRGIFGEGAFAHMTVSRSTLEGNGADGIFAQNGIATTLTDVVTARNASAGINASGAGTRVRLQGSTIAGNSGNGVVVASGALVLSLQNNAIVDNVPAT